MENPFDQLTVTAGHELLFKHTLTLNDVIELISQYPAIIWLDLFSKIEGFLIIQREKGFDPQIYLSENLFPSSTLTRVKSRKNERMAFFSIGQLNILRKIAIAYGSKNSDLEIPKTVISKVLLAAHDLHSEYDKALAKEGTWEIFARFIIRNGYLNSQTNLSTLTLRTSEMYVEQAKKLEFAEGLSFAEFFEEIIGLSIDEAMALSFALVVPFFQDKELSLGQTTIINPKNYFEQTVIDSVKVGSIFKSMTADFEVVKAEVLNELKDVDVSVSPVGYNLSVFKKTPLLRLEDGRLVCMSLSALTQKATQNIMWMPVSTIDRGESEKRNKMINDLTQYRGRLFEEYLKDICATLESKNKDLQHVYIPAESTQDGEEIGDSILLQGKNLIILEAKSRQFNESFKATGDWNKDKYFLDELIIKGTNQIQKAATKILNGEIKGFPLKPEEIEKIYPVIVSYESVPMHGKMQRFIREKINEAGHLTSNIFAPTEIINIGDMERLTDISGSLSIIDLLNTKQTQGEHASETSFHNFFSKYLLDNTVLSDGSLKSKADKIYENAIKNNLKFKELEDKK